MAELAIYEALVTARTPDDLAQKANNAMITADQVATKHDIDQLKIQLAELETRLTLRIVAISTAINAAMLTVAVVFIKLL